MTKKFFVLLSATVFVVVLISCSVCMSQTKNEHEGWINPDTFRAQGFGVSTKSSSAKEAALLMAEKKILEEFINEALKGASGMADENIIRTAIAKEFKELIKGGSIVKETNDSENQICELEYQVVCKGLKKRVREAGTLKIKAMRQLKSIEHHSKTAEGMSEFPSKKEAGMGFDTAGVIAVDGRDPNPGKEPVVPEGKRTAKITELEKKRDTFKKKRKELEKKVSKIEGKAHKTPEETVELANLKQKLSETRNNEIFMNFSINEELLKSAKRK